MTDNTEQHKASTEQWALIESTPAACLSGTILELRARVEALEVLTNHFRDARNMVPTPASSLVERVVDALANASGSDWEEAARAAIREVAAAVRSRGDRPFTWEHVAQWLEQEADR